ncbi:hypothetical protein HLI_00065 [Halobacillus litoralis]|uniref:Uncharacterized protein n=1 Tax=Halobacillus litoralis TaxID=45668 RepID=A0A410M712_9BACI|nr:hypothetical protein HLI_00065 [Halobacillus litoralis]
MTSSGWALELDIIKSGRALGDATSIRKATEGAPFLPTFDCLMTSSGWDLELDVIKSERARGDATSIRSSGVKEFFHSAALYLCSRTFIN